MTKLSDQEHQATIAEYNALRSEILTLIQARNQFLFIDLGGFSLVFGWYFTASHPNDILLLVVPLIYYPLALYWTYADNNMLRIGRYIKQNIEPHYDNMAWEKTIFGLREKYRETYYFTTFGKHIPNAIKTYCPRWLDWALRLHSSSELSGIITFAGTTVISFLFWFLTHTSSYGVIVLVLFTLDIGVLFYCFRLIYSAESTW